MATTQLLDKRQTRTNADSPADSALKVRISDDVLAPTEN
jgi:hypothetical protein